MKRRKALGAVALAAGVLLCKGCASTSPERGVLGGGESQLKLRSIQSRAYDTVDRQRVLRGVIATLQDLEFMIEAADAELGTVTARRFVMVKTFGVNNMIMTVTVRPYGETRMLVRANAEFNNQRVDDPLVYQNFFAALGRSLFLAGQEVE
ncbi:MAG TPA: hypothetical protein VJ789_02305 [Burkholderiales bacterium]|nr:hypothetical protein [Burkholderiales bacterium]